jgi:hypothetical protein
MGKPNFDYDPDTVYSEIFSCVDEMCWENSWGRLQEQFSCDDDGKPLMNEEEFRELCDNFLMVTYDVEPESFDEDFVPPKHWNL